MAAKYGIYRITSEHLSAVWKSPSLVGRVYYPSMPNLSSPPIIKIEEPIRHSRENFGLKNLNQRLKLFYGPSYGLHIEKMNQEE